MIDFQKKNNIDNNTALKIYCEYCNESMPFEYYYKKEKKCCFCDKVINIADKEIEQIISDLDLDLKPPVDEKDHIFKKFIFYNMFGVYNNFYIIGGIALLIFIKVKLK